MRRDAFDHVLRAAASILGTDEVLVIGSQALHASLAGRPFPEAERSTGVDIAVFGDRTGALADLIDGSIGEASLFHRTFGYYAQGVTEATAVLPAGWKQRLVRYQPSTSPGITAWCLEPHDLWIARAIAHRPRDLEFCRAMQKRELVDAETLADRLESVEQLPSDLREAITRLLAG